VQWLPALNGQNTQPGELWPSMEHSCGAQGSVNPEATSISTDGSFGDPGVRIAQFVNAFPNSLLQSVCDASYASAMQVIASKLGDLMAARCIPPSVQLDAAGQPACTLTERSVDAQGNHLIQMVPNCNADGNVAPCWTATSGGGCAGTELVVNDPSNAILPTATLTCPR
jgi:hypothetical protein